MPVMTLTNEQVVDLVRQLPANHKRTALLSLALHATARREARMEYAQMQLRRVCAERGLDWETMSEDERETFIDDFLHEDE